MSSHTNKPQQYVVISDECLPRDTKLFFEDKANLERFKKFQEGTEIARTTVNWLVVNYAKAFPERCRWRQADGTMYDLFADYEQQTLGVTKKGFDVFCRGPRIMWKGLKTTQAQIKFVHWLLRNNIFEFAVEHKEEIQQHKDEVLTNRKIERETEKKVNENLRMPMLKPKRKQLCSMAKAAALQVIIPTPQEAQLCKKLRRCANVTC